MKLKPIETAPKDGTKIWGWLYDTGIVLMHWMTAQQNADEAGHSGAPASRKYDGRGYRDG